MVEPAGQALAPLPDDQLAPICRALGALDGRQRGIELELTRTAGDANGDWLLSARAIEDDYGCAGEVAARSPAALTGCGAERGGAAVCLVGLEPALADLDARFESLPRASRGTLVLTLHLDAAADRDAAVTDLADALAAFVHTEQVFVAAPDPQLLLALREALRQRQVYNLRTALYLEDRAGVLGEASLDEAYAGQIDVVLVPARRYDDLGEDASRIALAEGGVAFGVYRADTPADYAGLVERRGLDLALGALAPALAEAWSVAPPGAFDCRAFLETRQRLARYVAQSAASCPVF